MRFSSLRGKPLALLAAGAVGIASALTAQAASTALVSVSASGDQGFSGTYHPQISADGRYVVFDSYSDQLVSGDTNGTGDVFVKDMVTGEVKIASSTADGTLGNVASSQAQISSDGRFVLFASPASNLTPGDTNHSQDVFVKDMQTGELKLASITPGGVRAVNAVYPMSMSDDGRYVAMYSAWSNFNLDGNGDSSDVFVKDLQTGELFNPNTASGGAPGAGMADQPRISANGRTLVFRTESVLLPGDTNGSYEVYALDLQTRELKLVNAAADGTIGNWYAEDTHLSADGRYVSFSSGSSNLVPGDTNGVSDVFVKDLQTGEIKIASSSPGGAPANQWSQSGRLSADGRYVAFASWATNLADSAANIRLRIYRKDLQTGAVEVSGAFGAMEGEDVIPPSISADGRHIAHLTEANQVSPQNGDTQVCVWDAKTGTLDHATVGVSGGLGQGYSAGPQMSADGKYVAFYSEADNLVTGDVNGLPDIFLRTRDIAPDDAENPEAVVTLPADGATYIVGEPVTADFSCTDSGSGLASSNGCVGTVADGENIDTATPGVKSFTVDAKDAAGNTASKTVSYTVVAGGNNAEFVSQVVPAYMAPGQSYTVAVTLKNTGTSYWTPGQRFYLSSQNPVANKTWGPNLVSLSVGANVAPGDTYTFRFWVKAPSAPAVYNFQWRMAQYGVEWFGEASPNVAVSVGTNDAEVVSQVAPPSTMIPGQRAIVSVTVKNTGATAWTYGTGFVLSAQNPVGNRTWGTCLRYLPAGVSVAPGQSHTFTFVATAPSTPGVYHFQWRMAQSGVAWFGDTSPDVTVTVQ